MSFVLARKMEDTVETSLGNNRAETKKRLSLRITSDFIRLPDLHKSGYYACSELGLVLAVDKSNVHPQNGELLTIGYPEDTTVRDKKSGAVLLEI